MFRHYVFLVSLLAGTPWVLVLPDPCFGDPPAPLVEVQGQFNSPQWSPDGAWIAMSCAAQQGIYLVRPDGTGLRRLTDEPGAGRGFAWSPDGKFIAFRARYLGDTPPSTRPEGAGVTDSGKAAGEAPKHEPSGEASKEPAGPTAKTPDNEKASKAPGTQPEGGLRLALRVAPIADSGVRTIVESKGDIGVPTWLNPTTIRFTLEGKATIAGIDGKMVKRGAATNAHILAKVAGTDRTIIADASEDDRVVILHDDGTKKYLTKHEDGRFYGPMVSPRGDRVLVHNLANDHVCVIDLGNERRTDLGQGLSARWSPEGRRIVCFVAADDGHNLTTSDLYLIDASTGERQKLTDTPDRLETHPVWAPDGKHIAYADAKSGSIFIQTLSGKGLGK